MAINNPVLYAAIVQASIPLGDNPGKIQQSNSDTSENQ